MEKEEAVMQDAETQTDMAVSSLDHVLRALSARTAALQQMEPLLVQTLAAIRAAKGP